MVVQGVARCSVKSLEVSKAEFGQSFLFFMSPFRWSCSKNDARWTLGLYPLPIPFALGFGFLGEPLLRIKGVNVFVSYTDNQRQF